MLHKLFKGRNYVRKCGSCIVRFALIHFIQSQIRMNKRMFMFVRNCSYWVKTALTIKIEFKSSLTNLELILDPHLERAKRAEKVLGVTALKMRTNTGDSLPVWSTRVTRSPDSMGSGSSGPVNMKSRGPWLCWRWPVWFVNTA